MIGVFIVFYIIIAVSYNADKNMGIIFAAALICTMIFVARDQIITAEHTTQSICGATR